MKLTPEERELIATYNDGDRTWHIHSDSSTMRGRILKLAAKLGVQVVKSDIGGVEFEVPGDALRLTARRRGSPSGTSFRTANGRTTEAKNGLVGATADDCGRVNGEVASV